MPVFNLKDQLKLNLRFLKYMGLWPSHHGYLASFSYLLLSVFINFFLVFLFNFTLVVNLYYLTDDLESFTANGYVVLVCAMGTVKGYYMIRKSNAIKILVKGINKNEIQLTGEQKTIMVEYFKGWKNLHFVFAIIIPIVTAMLWAAYPFLDEQSSGNGLPFPAWYPYDYTSSVFWYGFSYAHQMISITIIAFMNSNVDTLMSGMMAYIAAECEVLCDFLRNMHKTKREYMGKLEDKDDGLVLDEMNASLVMLVHYHKKIITYTKGAESYFNSYLIFQFIVSALTIAMCMFNMSVRSPSSAEFFAIISYQMGITTELLNYCWYGNEIILKSGKLSYAAYECSWVEAPQIFKKNLAFFIHRTQKPIKIYAVNWIVLSLDTFMSILRTSWSYFALLRQVNIKD